MDLSQLGAGEVKVEVGDAALKETAHEVVDLLSDEELALESPVKATSRDHPHLDETDSDDSSVVGYEAVGEDDRWEIESLPESLLEQNLEEIGDEHLHNGSTALMLPAPSRPLLIIDSSSKCVHA